MKCTNCGSEEEHSDEIKGETLCAGCGRVKIGKSIVANLAFNNQNVTGKFGSKTGEYSQIRSIWARGRDSDEFRLAKAFKMINHIGNALNLPSYIIEASQRLYKLVQGQNWVQGRHTSHVVAASMYITCRRERTPHLLIDFSDKLQVNLYTLGSTYLKLIKFLHFEMPVIDPS